MDLRQFQVNIYLLMLIFGVIDFPAKFIAVFTATFIGRRVAQGTVLILAGLTLMANAFIPQDSKMVRVAIAVFGKGCLAASACCVTLYSKELYPTVLRPTALGMSYTMFRLGAMISTMPRMLDDYVPYLAGVTYAAFCILSGITAFLLPETRGLPLLETTEQAENRYQCQEGKKRIEALPKSSSSKPEEDQITCL